MSRSRVPSRVIPLVLSILLLSACNGATEGSGSRPTATFGPAVQTRLAEASRPRPTRTPTPESQAAAPTATSLPTATPQPTSTPVPDPANELLTLALLNQDDFTEEWWIDEPYIYTDEDMSWSGDDDMLHSHQTDEYCGTEIDDPYINQASNVYGQDEAGWVVVQFIALYPTEQHADLYLSELVTVMQQCTAYEEEYEGQIETVTVSQMDYPPAGDRSAAFVVVTSGTDYQFEAVLVGYRIGRTVTLILHAGESASSGPVEEWGTRDISARSYEKIMSLIDQIDALERPANEVI